MHARDDMQSVILCMFCTIGFIDLFGRSLYNSIVKIFTKQFSVCRKEKKMNMKVMNITDVEKFFGVIDQCEEKVELVTDDGDRYNLKSKLSQYVALSKVFFGGVIPVIELVTHCPSDAGKIMKYMMNN